MSKATKIRVAHRLQSGLVVGVSLLLRILPEPVAQALGYSLGWVAGSILRIRRGTVHRNLRRAFPDRPEAWRRRVARRVFPHIGREGVTLLRMAGLPSQELLRRTRVDGWEVLEEARAEGRGVLLATGHLGNWEIGGGALAVRGVPLDAVVRRQKNPLVDRRLRRTREALGISVIYREDAPRQILKSVRRGRVVALAADQNVRRGGIFVDFFGVPASTARGPAYFSLRTGAPLVLAFCHRIPGWRARYLVRFHRPPTPQTGDMEEDIRTLTRSYLAVLEEEVRRSPEQYFWPHKRWKTRPPGLDGGEEPDGDPPV